MNAEPSRQELLAEIRARSARRRRHRRSAAAFSAVAVIAAGVALTTVSFAGGGTTPKRVDIAAAPTTTSAATATNAAATTVTTQARPVTTAPPSTAVAQQVPTCPASGLSVSAYRGSGSVGQESVVVLFTNMGKSTCQMVGYPTAWFIGGHGTRIGPTSIHRASAAPTTVTLSPNSQASTTVWTANPYFGPCNTVTAAGLEVVPPNQTVGLTVTIAIPICSSSTDGINSVAIDPVVQAAGVFAGSYHFHVTTMEIEADGTGTASWRAGPSGDPNGTAYASFHLINVAGNSAAGVVYTSTEPARWAPGQTFQLTLNSDDMLFITPSGPFVPMCGSVAANESNPPPGVNCGA